MKTSYTNDSSLSAVRSSDVLGQNMKLENISVQSVQARCRGGAELSECIREAAMLALEQEQVVTFKHNEKEYTADFKAIVDSIYKQHSA